MKQFLLLFVIICVCSEILKVHHDEAQPTYSLKFIGSDLLNDKFSTCEIIKLDMESQIHRLVNNEGDISKKTQKTFVDRMPQQLLHLTETKGQSEVVEIFGVDKESVLLKAKDMCVTTFLTKQVKEEFNDEVEKIVNSGPSNNRIDVVFMGDGYTVAQKPKHKTDMIRLVKDMFDGETFKNYLPLFNIWSVYRSSVESGVGTHGRAKNTAFRLYRQGTQLRGLFPGNPAGIRSACSKTGPSACNFPTVIGNDDYYGGLGGEFAVSTSSETTGTVVLRHEFGHNFGRIGEEYDSGGYFGANYAASTSVAQSKWGKWLSAPVKAQNSANRINAYPWNDLASGPLNLKFRSDGKFKRYFLRFSISGCETQDSFEVSIDGKKLDWTTSGLLDRSFYEYKGEQFTAGEHTLSFKQLTQPNGPIRQVCNVGLNEYMNDDEFKWDNEHINAYPLYNGQSRNGFRSQNEFCLMRNMTSRVFCHVCRENLWLQFLGRINAIDTVNVDQSTGTVAVTANLVKIGQFREGGAIAGETFEITWTRNGQEQTDLKNKNEWKRSPADSKGSWVIIAKFISKEIRSDPSNLTTFRRSFSIQ